MSARPTSACASAVAYVHHTFPSLTATFVYREVRAVREAGVLSIMPAYNSRDGVPCTCDKWLLTDVLRGEWKFKGLVVSDYGATAQIYGLHNAARGFAEAAKKALEAGMDLELPNPDCFSKIPDLITKGELSERLLDRSVK